MLTFTPKKNVAGYTVFDGNRVLGSVRKTELWVVRGTRIAWDAYKAGKYLGQFETRKAAAAHLQANS